MSTTWISWRTSSRRCNSMGQCVEVGESLDGVVGLRDSKDHARGPVLIVARPQWKAFLNTVRTGRLAPPA